MCGVTQFCGVSICEGLFCLEFPRVMQQPKNSMGFQKSMSSTSSPSVCFFLECSIFLCMGVKPLFSHLSNIFTVNILSKVWKIPFLMAFYKLFLREIKIKILINFWHSVMTFSDVPSVAFNWHLQILIGKKERC